MKKIFKVSMAFFLGLFFIGIIYSKPTMLSYTQSGTEKAYGFSKTPQSQESELYGMINVPYALCSKALCIVDKNNPSLSVCTCPIYGLDSSKNLKKQVSVGPHSLKNSQPTYKNGKLETVVSNFSLANLTPGNKNITCAFDTKQPWANCFGIRCTVRFDKKGIPHAICHCPIDKNKKFISVGPVNTKQCKPFKNKIWSAALPDQGPDNQLIIQELDKIFK